MKIREIHHDFINLSNGIKLAYRAWLPVNAEQNPVPAILEYLPYRKNDGTVVRDELTMPATAKHGYACIRVDIRGTGESDGLFDDEYSEQELSDGELVIDWLSRQVWCDGNVGMVGISWGGFNSLQLAYRQPPALKTIITICSTTDRFNEDIHYAGGCLLNDNLDWAAFFWAYAQARCPDPRLVGENWKQQWLHRLNNMPLLADKWLSESSKNQYWRHGSVNEDFSKIKIPVYAISGWADAYRNSVFDLLENLQSPCKGLIGPWAHKYPNIAYPGPKIDYVKESVRWWDKWLKGIENHIMAEPKLHYYLMDSVEPCTDYSYRTGRWQSEQQWPSSTISYQHLLLEDSTLVTKPQVEQATVEIDSPGSTGQMAGKLMVGIGYSGEFPGNQQLDDNNSASFDTLTLNDAFNIVGQPLLTLAVASDQTDANVIARLCDIHPNGQSTLITYCVLNLKHHSADQQPKPITVGQYYNVQLQLHHIAYQVPAGHKIRVSISNNYWPLIWPTPIKNKLTLALEQCCLMLPNKQHLIPTNNPALADVSGSDLYLGEEIRAGKSTKSIDANQKTGTLLTTTDIDYGCYFHPSCETKIDFTVKQILSIHPNRPNSAKSKSYFNVSMEQGDVITSLKGQYEMTSTVEYYAIRVKWQAYIEKTCVFEKDFDQQIVR
ncbi:CocE/NonD family hydrolase [Thalassotalea psychrophila]|uniref:CocE/NonD family hydrolase n=1 Tax=Thalassotalea psychrophila TaxID=3065647 RepID=A0ABY9TVD0_9GAMM|nr:CocE/NonD family hydrolase [Colwelliaceae bacterium SQ149]